MHWILVLAIIVGILVALTRVEIGILFKTLKVKMSKQTKPKLRIVVARDRFQIERKNPGEDWGMAPVPAQFKKLGDAKERLVEMQKNWEHKQETMELERDNRETKRISLEEQIKNDAFLSEMDIDAVSINMPERFL